MLPSCHYGRFSRKQISSISNGFHRPSALCELFSRTVWFFQFTYSFVSGLLTFLFQWTTKQPSRCGMNTFVQTFDNWFVGCVCDLKANSLMQCDMYRCVWARARARVCVCVCFTIRSTVLFNTGFLSVALKASYVELVISPQNVSVSKDTRTCVPYIVTPGTLSLSCFSLDNKRADGQTREL